ncbi:NIPSNAP family protein [Burkholderiaceae bacterium DAT-1]|nr:NIPSNAP family protein [Burkholderiaceae bacterium DAT-1]
MYHDGMIEIRTYQLKPGCGARFHYLVTTQSVPLLRAAGEVVLAANPSLHSDDRYILIRAYRDLAHREQSQNNFYASTAWRRGPREAIIACIENSIDVVLAGSQLLDQYSSLMDNS